MSRFSGANRQGPRKRALQVMLTDEEYDAIDYVAAEMHLNKSAFARVYMMRAVKDFEETTRKKT